LAGFWLVLGLVLFPNEVLRAAASGEGTVAGINSEDEDGLFSSGGLLSTGGLFSAASFSGFVEVLEGARLSSPGGEIGSRVKLRLETGFSLGPLYFHLAGQAEKNRVVKSETGAGAYEMWVEHVGDGFDVRVGRQIIIWGKADGVQITDVVCPPDYTEYITRTLDEIRRPVDAARVRILGENTALEIVWIPFFRAGVNPGPDSPWYLGPPGGGLREVRERKPARGLGGGEIGLRAAGYFSGLDAAVSFFRGYSDFPTLGPPVSSGAGGGPSYREALYHKSTVLGLEMSKPSGNFVFRGEAAATLGRVRQSRDMTAGPVKENSVHYLAGLDWTPGSDWTISGQFSGERILGDNDSADPTENYLATLSVSKKFLRQILTVSDMVYLDLSDRGFYNSLKFDYEVSDGLIVTLGLDVFRGSGGMFSFYEDNSQAWFKVKYYF
jgi:hypothetical protein